MSNQILKIGGLVYLTDDESKTASIIRCDDCISDVIIPSSITSFSNVYAITTISEGAFHQLNKLKSIRVSADSKLQIIERDAFHGSSIESITLPSSLTELKDHWCSSTTNLIDIKISPKNPYFKIYENKYLLKKSSLEKENFDVLVMCFRNVKNASIPNFIEVIEPHAFECIEKVETTSNSKLRKICEMAFAFSSLEYIKFSYHITEILDRAFLRCNNLKQIEIPENSNLRLIGEEVFYETTIKSIPIPSHITKISDRAFYGCKNLSKIKIPFDSNLQIIGEQAFFESAIDRFTISSHITKICDRAFYECNNLCWLRIAFDSNLQTIGELAFSKTSIESIKIPDQLTSIGKSAFFYCKKLRKVEISQNSQLQIISGWAFYGTKLRSFSIPPNLKIIGKDAFKRTEIQIIEFNQNLDMTTINTIIKVLNEGTIVMIPLNLSIRFNLYK